MNIHQPLIAVDVVPLTFTPAGGVLVGSARRRSEPFAGRPALPGVLLAGSELLADAARRALRDKAQIGGDQVRYLGQLGAFDMPGRDPREHAISVTWLAVIAPMAEAEAGGSIEWAPIGDAPLRLPFDHDAIVTRAIETARLRIWQDMDFTRALTGSVFTSTDAAHLIGSLTGTAPHAGNLHRSLSHNTQLERLPGVRFGGNGRPATVWRWRDETL